MALYYAYKQTNSVSLEESESDQAKYLLIKDDDIKMGLVIPSANPLISHDVSFEITANSLEEAEEILKERAENEMFI